MDDLAARRDALRQAAIAPGADPWTLLEAALTELDGAVDALDDAESGPADGRTKGGGPDTLQAERRLLRAAFQQAPAVLLLLAPNGTIRRASNKAAELLGTPTGYATGKPLTTFVDMPERAAVQTQLAAVVRTGEVREAPCRMLTPAGLIDVTLTVSLIELPADPPVLAATIAQRSPAGTRKPARGKPDAGSGDAASGDSRHVASMARRLDMVTAVTRLLLDNSMFSEAVSIQRCARLLVGEFADWVIVDLARDGGLQRQVAIGPRGPEADRAARTARGVDPGPSTLPGQVHASGKSMLLVHVPDPAALGTAVDGTPLLMTLRAASLLVVPVSDGTVSYGTMTLARHASSGPFTVADLALAEDLCGHLATAMRVDRMFRRRSEEAEALLASLLPDRLPEVPGLELAASYIGGTKRQEISGDFYDVFNTPSGWAVLIGDVSGVGHEAVVMSSAARHAIRALAHVHCDPADVLAAASQVLATGDYGQDYGERFVTSILAFPDSVDGRCRVRLGNAGQPGPALVRADGRVEILAGDQLPLGLLSADFLPDGRPARMDLELDAGDMLLFYTDGVTQARSEKEEYFDDRLADALAATAGRPAAEAVHTISEQLTDFCRGDFRDDVTMLAMRVR